MSNDHNTNATNQAAQPMPIAGGGGHRRRSSSVWSNNFNPGISPSSSASNSTLPSTLITPSSFANYPRPAVSPTAHSPLSYFLPPSSPVKSNISWDPPVRGGIPGKSAVEGSAVADDDDPASFRKLGHARTVSGSWAAKNHERGSSLMRRLSLGGALSSTRPPVSPPTSEMPTQQPAMPTSSSSQSNNPIWTQNGDAAPKQPERRDAAPIIATPTPKRRLTVKGDPVKKRAVSPMGERMLKGHFDGFGL